MKTLCGILIVLLVIFQYKLWVNKTGVAKTLHLKQDVAALIKQNDALRARNTALHAQVKDLREGHLSVEAHARNELGMVKPGEQFYQVIPPVHQRTP